MSDKFIQAVRDHLRATSPSRNPTLSAAPEPILETRPNPSSSSNPSPIPPPSAAASASISAPPVSHVIDLTEDSPDCSDSQPPPINPPPKKRRNLDPSSSDCAGPSKAKRSRAPTPTELRGSRYRPHPSQAVLDRRLRSNTHRLFLVARDGGPRPDAPVFVVMGSNGNVYRCTISNYPQCTCPDFIKRADSSAHGPCKHLIFVFLRVLKVKEDDPVWWQVRLIPEELTRILADAPPTARLDCMAENSVREQYAAVSAQPHPSSSTAAAVASSNKDNDTPAASGDCPVCFEGMGPGSGSDTTSKDNATGADPVTACGGCRQYFHERCLKMWARAQPADPTCPLCRAKLPRQSVGLATPATEQTTPQYTNLASYSTTHTRTMTLAELYADTHEYLGRGGGGGRGGRGRGRR